MDILFEPEYGKDLRKTYPELSAIEEFKKISAEQMLFVWCFACPALNDYNMSEKERMIKSLDIAFPGKADIKSKYVAYNMPEVVKIAIEKMKNFDIGVRSRARNMVNKMLENFENLVNIDINNISEFSDEKGKVDWSKKKAYVDSCEKISKTLPDLIAQVESGFGIIQKAESETFKSSRAIDRYHESK